MSKSFFSVIGRGGEQINKLQSETGAKIQVAPGKLWCIFYLFSPNSVWKLSLVNCPKLYFCNSHVVYCVIMCKLLLDIVHLEGTSVTR